MANDAGGRMKVVIYYAVWATLCAVVAGIVITLIHTWFFSYNPGRSWLVHTLVSDILTAILLAAGQGAVALVTGSLLAHLGRQLHGTVLLGLLVGAFDFVMDFVQMAAPATEVGWVPDMLVFAVASISMSSMDFRGAAA